MRTRPNVAQKEVFGGVTGGLFGCHRFILFSRPLDA